MKLLFVGTDRDRAGGAAHFVALARAMAAAGHDVLALVDRHSAIGERLDEAGIALRHARFRNVFDVKAQVALARAIDRQQPDWLVGDFGKEYWPLIAHGRRSRIPVALFRQRVPAMKRVSEWLVPRLAQRFIAVSAYSRSLFIDRGMPAQRVHTLYNPVDTTIYRPDPEARSQLRMAMGIPEDAIVAGFVGRMYADKGIFVLREAVDAAMASEPRLHCLWVGEGPELTDLGEAIRNGRYAGRHHVAGWRADAHLYFNAMSLLAFPTIMSETFGRVSVEAQACGIPVLGSRLGGIPETLLEGVTGRLLPAGDVPAWRDGILELCDEPLARSMGIAARDHVEKHFSYPVIAADFASLLQRGETRATAAPPGQ